MTKTILIKGRKVKCSALLSREQVKKTDVFSDGTRVFHTEVGRPFRQGDDFPIYRPIPAKSKKGKPHKGAPITVWLGANGQVIGALTHHQIKRLTGELFPTFPMEVTITIDKIRRKK